MVLVSKWADAPEEKPSEQKSRSKKHGSWGKRDSRKQQKGDGNGNGVGNNNDNNSGKQQRGDGNNYKSRGSPSVSQGRLPGVKPVERPHTAPSALPTLGGHTIGIPAADDVKSSGRTKSPVKRVSERPVTAPLNKGPKSKAKPANDPKKTALLREKLEEQRRIFAEKERKSEQQKLLDDFLNDDSTLNWADDIDEDDQQEALLEGIGSLKV
ncbi:Gfd1p KNAG_0J00480 [Huiozyma naganishii CBS 8797]|uniref:Uncharacterized protein n=1 Tax=Huiozyma naganishii (strain ATCC MYA-139 / BCRC 22969 / CBS 8797 / KCTC 17520 / NBRC 10181 / NCYC 3082 / Yp74L-3) TaxID=1071383 RepID=J7SAF9_HUIN7|nr:hypothetical protein KNAG_0J00480 [Kazachstania naganishii CBS 8797]CCK72131.1 hypothetical protein KNAG_0J00480 [Kazachstania naganishii CBS 8797]